MDRDRRYTSRLPAWSREGIPAVIDTPPANRPGRETFASTPETRAGWSTAERPIGSVFAEAEVRRRSPYVIPVRKGARCVRARWDPPASGRVDPHSPAAA